MIYACVVKEKLELHEVTAENQSLLKDALWIDMLSPTKEEERLVEESLILELPTRDEMVEIEVSSRLYKESGVVFMTAAMIAQSDSPDPKLDPVTFVLAQQQLVTIRYIEPQSFKLIISHLKKLEHSQHNAIGIFIELLDATVDRLADILELVGRRLDDYSKTIFRPQEHNEERLDYRHLLQQIGANGELNTKARESLVTFNRLLTFFGQSYGSRLDEETLQRLSMLGKDISSLSDHANFLSSKVNFLLDATLGLVNIEQNNIIKIFSVAAVIFLPPTLIASIYGMNFQFMPELNWKYGYIFSIGLIMVAAWLPYKYFKYRKWL
jgi:magnesium transporter